MLLLFILDITLAQILLGIELSMAVAIVIVIVDCIVNVTSPLRRSVVYCDMNHCKKKKKKKIIPE